MDSGYIEVLVSIALVQIRRIRLPYRTPEHPLEGSKLRMLVRHSSSGYAKGALSSVEKCWS